MACEPGSAMSLVLALLGALRAALRTRTDLTLENLALQQQLALLRRRSKRPKFGLLDRAFWMWLSQWWTRWSEVLHVVKPQTVIRWHRQSFRAFWTWKSRRGRVGRPRVGAELANLVRTGAGEPALGRATHPRRIAEARVRRLAAHRGAAYAASPETTIADMEDVPPKPRRRPCLSRFLRRADCHIPNPLRVRGPAAPSPASRALQRHGLPTAAWTAQQIVEAFPDDSAPRYLLRDRDSIYGGEFRRRVKGMCIAEVLSSPRSPWQNPFAERVIGTLRRELLDHVIVLSEGHLRRHLRSLSLDKT